MKKLCKIVIDSPFPLHEKAVRRSLKNQPGWLSGTRWDLEFFDTEDSSIVSIDITHNYLNDPCIFKDIIREFEKRFMRSTVRIDSKYTKKEKSKKEEE